MKKTIILLAVISFFGKVNTEAQTINTIAGNGALAFSGDGGPATAASIVPNGITEDRHGNIYFVDDAGHRIRKITVSTGIITTVAGNGSITYASDGVAATTTAIDPMGVAVDTSGNIYIADATNNRVRMVNASGIISTIAGTGFAGWSGDGAAAISAKLDNPMSVALDTHGNLFIGQGTSLHFDLYVRKIVLATGIITTYAGNSSSAYGGADNHLATWAGVTPTGLATDSVGNLYIADRPSSSIRKVNLHDTITTVAGTGMYGFSGDGGVATLAKLYSPSSIAVDTANNLYINDCYNYRIRKVNMTTGIISTYCGTGASGFYGDGGPATAAKIANISSLGILADKYGVILSDYDNARLRRICFGNAVPTIFITGVDTVCAGTSVAYSSVISGGGGSPTYQWQVNGINVSTGSTFSYTPINGDIVKCILTSSATCAFPDTAVSASITMVVNPTVTPSISISASATTVCAGMPVSFTSSVTGGGSPGYEWKVNGINVATGSTYSYLPANGDVVICSLSSTAICAAPTTVLSRIVTMTVNALPLIYSVGGSGTYLDTGIVTLSNSQSGVTYQLFNGSSPYGLPVSGSGGILTFDVTASGIYYIVATETSGGCFDTTTTSANVVVSPSSVATVGVGESIRIYPNPTEGQLNIEGSKLYSLQVIDITGRVLDNRVCDTTKVTIDITNLSSGLYLVKINGQFVQKFIKE
jgi:hypothetical protein